MEVNERLAEKPELLNLKAGAEGFIAIVQPRKELENKLPSHWLTQQAYSAGASNDSAPETSAP